MNEPTVVFDFDGVIHSYKSGWIEAEIIPDPPVPGIAMAIAEIRKAGYRVVVASTRCATENGKTAVWDYLTEHNIRVDDVTNIKPPAVCYIDDRAICFDGKANGLLQQVIKFKPWHMRPGAAMVMSSEDVSDLITNILMEIGIPMHIKGHRYIRDALRLTVGDDTCLEGVTKILYPSVAKLNESTVPRVERAIRHAIEYAWDNTDHEVLDTYFRNSISCIKGKPTNAQFLASMTWAVKKALKAQNH